MRYFFHNFTKDKNHVEEVRIIQDYGKSFIIERYDRIEERWYKDTVNALFIVPEDKLADRLSITS
jgi:hypothetical protein